MEINSQPMVTQQDRLMVAKAKCSLVRMVALIAAATFISIGAILLADGLADASNRVPGSGKRYWDRKESKIAGAFLAGGGLAVAMSYGVFRPRYGRRSTLQRTALALGGGLILSAAMRGVDVRFDKPHWFTTNVPCKIPFGDGRYWDTKIRQRALLESMIYTLGENR